VGLEVELEEIEFRVNNVELPQVGSKLNGARKMSEVGNLFDLFVELLNFEGFRLELEKGNLGGVGVGQDVVGEEGSLDCELVLPLDLYEKISSLQLDDFQIVFLDSQKERAVDQDSLREREGCHVPQLRGLSFIFASKLVREAALFELVDANIGCKASRKQRFAIVERKSVDIVTLAPEDGSKSPLAAATLRVLLQLERDDSAVNA